MRPDSHQTFYLTLYCYFTSGTKTFFPLFIFLLLYKFQLVIFILVLIMTGSNVETSSTIFHEQFQKFLQVLKKFRRTLITF